MIDNIAILCKMKVINWDYKTIKRVGYPMWLLGLLSALFYYIAKLNGSFEKESNLKTSMVNTMTPKEFCTTIKAITQERKNYSLNIIRILGDLIVAF